MKLFKKKNQQKSTLFSQSLNNLQKITNKKNLILLIAGFIRIALIVTIFLFLWKTSNHFVNEYLSRIYLKRQKISNKAKNNIFLKTITPILQSIVHWVLIIIVILLILSELNFNIMPIIYSFSVLGLAISIGSQALVKDLINGVLTLFEGNMAVGDFIKIGTNEGYVESMNLSCEN
jgi:small-conductance mechanosensitive channel